MLEKGMYIGGQIRQSQSGESYTVYNPADKSSVGVVPLGCEKDMEDAIGAANLAQGEWGRQNPFKRSKILREASLNALENAREIARVMSCEQGKPYKEALQEVEKGANILRYYAEEAERVYGRIVQNESGGAVSSVIYQPIGVSGAISPWNYPVELLAWKLGAAMAAGCALVCKLPYETPLSPLMFIDCVAKAGVMPGAVNAVTGRGSLLGPVLADSPLVKKIAFTGSTKVGRELAERSAKTLKKLSLELGGSLPAIICGDCDLERAVEGTVRRSFRNLGQICIAINRVFVQDYIYEDFLEKLAYKTRALTIGNGSAENVDLGAMCARAGLEKVKEHVEDARAKGARILTGGRELTIGKYKDGNFYEPTVVADATPDMLIMREETFGPAIGVSRFHTIDEAIAMANDSPYGLAAICYTSSLNTVHRVSNEVMAGNIAINNVDAGVMNAPYGGWKDSGWGYEHGPEGIYEYLKIKHIRCVY